MTDMRRKIAQRHRELLRWRIEREAEWSLRSETARKELVDYE